VEDGAINNLTTDKEKGERIHPSLIELRHLQRKPIRQSVLFAGKCVSCQRLKAKKPIDNENIM
jgi:hypothetical protein